jgi:hypothetical protein
MRGMLPHPKLREGKILGKRPDGGGDLVLSSNRGRPPDFYRSVAVPGVPCPSRPGPSPQARRTYERPARVTHARPVRGIAGRFRILPVVKAESDEGCGLAGEFPGLHRPPCRARLLHPGPGTAHDDQLTDITSAMDLVLVRRDDQAVPALRPSWASLPSCEKKRAGDEGGPHRAIRSSRPQATKLTVPRNARSTPQRATCAGWVGADPLPA